MMEETEKPLEDTDSDLTETGSSATETHANNGGTITPNEEPAGKPDRIVLTNNGGPRTQLGKLRSSQNAVKHGIFSAAILLQGESREELELLVAGLREALHLRDWPKNCLWIS